MRFQVSKRVGTPLAGMLAGLVLAASSATAQQPVQPPGDSKPQMAQIAEHPERPVVVELFSSQGCGNCPEANKVLASLAKRTDVLAITYPVGIWDYLGWDDTFAKPEFTARQKEYNKALEHRGPYTPQMVFGGRLHSSGVNLERIAQGFAQRDLTPLPVKVAFGAEDVTVVSASDAAAIVVVVRYNPGVTRVTPGAGANRGKAMDYFNLVTSLETLGQVAAGQTAKFKPRCDKGCTVLVQQKSPTGMIIGAAQRR
jgi:hypothetical protein